MNRWLFAVLTLAAASGIAGCNSATCGPGTMQVQQKNGTLQCVPTTAGPDAIPCDVDAGAEILGGVCVSRITCAPGTVPDPVTGQCPSTGGGGTPGVPPCPTPAQSTACVNGQIHKLIDNSNVTAADNVTVNVALYDPLAFLGGKPPLSTKSTSDGTFVFPNFSVPPTGLIALAVGDLNDETVYAVAGSGAQGIVAGTSYRVDAYLIPRSVVDGWNTTLGVNLLTTGAYLAKFYGEGVPPKTNLAATETMKVPGVTLSIVNTQNNQISPAPNAHYFGSSLMTIDTTLTVTGMEGAAIQIPPPNTTTQEFTGAGGITSPKTWEQQVGGTAAGVIFVSRFHTM